MRQFTHIPAFSPTDHLPSEWLSAYYDGELNGEALRLAEAHLVACPHCQAELQDLRQLSTLLGSVPAPLTRTAPARFVSQVMLRLPREAQPTWQARWGKRLWHAAPFGLFAGWAFLQAALLVTGLVVWFFDDLISGSPDLAFAVPSAQNDLLSAFQSLAVLTGLFTPVAQVVWINLLSTGLVAALFLAWLASWWAANRKER